MGSSTGLAVAMGAIVLTNNVILDKQPISSQRRVILGTLIFTAGLAGIERLSPELATGIAAIGLVTVLFVRVTPNSKAPVERVLEILE